MKAGEAKLFQRCFGVDLQEVQHGTLNFLVGIACGRTWGKKQENTTKKTRNLCAAAAAAFRRTVDFFLLLCTPYLLPSNSWVFFAHACCLFSVVTKEGVDRAV